MMRKLLKYSLIALFWLGLWQIVALRVGEELLLPSPISTVKALWELCKTELFWKTVGTSFLRILTGILISLGLGIVGGILAGIFPIIRDLFSPILAVIRATPVASFIVLLVLWMNRDSVPAVISVLMVLPVVWEGVRQGIATTDPKLLEMAKTFRLPFWRKIGRIYVPSVYPYLISATRASLGMAWKAGIAAEIITMPMTSIGRQIYYSSNNLQTAKMFGWTVAVILLSVVVDFGMSFLLRRLEIRKGMGGDAA